MTHLVVREVVALAYNAGWRGNDVVTATAVARAESSYDTEAEGPKLGCGHGAMGLWQINTCVHNCPNVTDPVQNAKCAHQIYQAQGWKAWEAYTNGAYKQYLLSAQQAYQAMQNGTEGSFGDVVKGVIAGLGSQGSPAAGLVAGAEAAGNAITEIPGVREIGSFFSALVDPNTWLRVAEIGLGVLLIAVGLAKLAPTSALVKATPVGLIARSLT